jgi:hypothetical protein
MPTTQRARIRTASKFGRDGLSLSMRRTWYADETKPGADAPTPPAPNTPGLTPASGGKWKMEDLPIDVQDYIKDLRTEAKTHREAKEAKEREASLAEQKRLADAGQFEQLAKVKAEEAAKPYQTRVADLEKVISDTNAQLIQQIPESIRALVVPDLPADKLNAWLIKSLPALTRKPAPETDAGAGMGGSGTKPLTDDDRLAMKLSNMTEEQYRKVQAKMNGQS